MNINTVFFINTSFIFYIESKQIFGKQQQLNKLVHKQTQTEFDTTEF